MHMLYHVYSIPMHLIPLIPVSFLCAFLPLLVFLETFLTGLVPSSMTVLSLLSMGLPGLHGFLPRMDCHRVLCWALFYTLSILLILVLLAALSVLSQSYAGDL